MRWNDPQLILAILSIFAMLLIAMFQKDLARLGEWIKKQAKTVAKLSPWLTMQVRHAAIRRASQLQRSYPRLILYILTPVLWRGVFRIIELFEALQWKEWTLVVLLVLVAGYFSVDAIGDLVTWNHVDYYQRYMYIQLDRLQASGAPSKEIAELRLSWQQMENYEDFKVLDQKIKDCHLRYS